ncbi:cellulase [Drepanopeziza brunnea f. sp. 'multigermtubi' MB_m1]|uniref:cellulase n=1 Tax=Marssonina brunnea f. sp. multigermtubi (strain MB_m1) TaxID=1072389 RepID=K1XH65_MARBU|nr:cellulase [Drepanopeziza brunnea f. sp. 'multigermtubi' MB_m1]EKD20103.1 cellulase [Drepanopeziza brunnea f. sp. 'multigermtubi' MB_m1]
MLLKAILLLGGVSWVSGKVQYMGTCSTDSAQSPMSSDALDQMQHFVNDDQMNVFRLPVSWQFLVNNEIGRKLDSPNFVQYDELMQACLGLGTHCVIDIHNFARFNGAIIGQGGPTDSQFADLWVELATKYKDNSKVIFGLMNEPHGLDVPTWAKTVQTVVTAIRTAGATSQMILLPGSDFASAGQFVRSGSADALIKVTNPDRSTDGLIFDLHGHLDQDNSGALAECTTDNVADGFAIAADFLRQNRRQALVSETRAGSAESCVTNLCAQNKFLNENSDVFLGYIAWAAGALPASDISSLTPLKPNGKYVDNELVSQCVVAPWGHAGMATPRSPNAAVAPPSTPSSPKSTEPTSTNAAVAIVADTYSPSAINSTETPEDALIGTFVRTYSKVETTAIPTSILAAGGTAPPLMSSQTGTRTSPPSTPPVATGGAATRKCAGWLFVGSLLVALTIG